MTSAETRMNDTSYRPLVHFTPRAGWMNDPNGLVYFNDEWHLFHQYYNPAEIDGMQWGHAVSRDLMHWQHLPPAIPPDEHGHIWSGSAVVDHENSSGLFGGKPGMVCLFTYWDPEDQRQCQGLAYSADGRQFAIYEGNPVIPQLRHLDGHPDDKDFRDPKVFFHAETKRWIMAVAGGKLRIFSSTNLIDWTFEHCHEDIHTECPDLFPLQVDGDPNRREWVLSGGGRWYSLGEFDGKRFIPTTVAIPFGAGPDFYATQTWSDAPDDRRVAISWIFKWGYGAGAKDGAIANPFPTGPIAGGSMGIPTELSLVTTEAGVRLRQQPVGELAALIAKASTRNAIAVKQGTAVPLTELGVACCDVDLELSVPVGATLILRLSTIGGQHVDLAVDNREQALVIDRRACVIEGTTGYSERFTTPLPIGEDGRVALRVLFDRSVLEVFADDGRTMMSAFVVPALPSAWQALAEGGECRIDTLSVRWLQNGGADDEY